MECKNPSGIAPLTDGEFLKIQRLVETEAGIYLSEAKKALVVARLSRRLRELGLGSFGEYYRLVSEGDGEEKVRMLDCICTNETQFFREPHHFEILERILIPGWRTAAEAGLRPRQVRAWSAACSTGEEAYSIAMVLLDHFPPESRWSCEVIGTDLSATALEVATNATWSISKSREIPQRYLTKFMLRGVKAQEGKMRAGPEIRSIVRLHGLNLNDQAYPMTGGFDLIFCRNVLIYFKYETRREVIDRLLDHLSPAGYMFLGHAESLNGMTDRVETLAPTVYKLNDAGTSGKGELR